MLLFLRRRLGGPVVQAVMIASAVVLVVAVIGITLFEAGALWYRSLPHGSGHERQGGGFEDFFAWARAGFFALDAALLLLALSCGFILGRTRARRGATAALATGIAIVAYLVLTLPLVEFMNACDVGRSFLIDDVSC